MDLQSWLGDRPGDDRELLAQRMVGATLVEIARDVGSTVSAAFRRLRYLGSDLAQRVHGGRGLRSGSAGLVIACELGALP